MNRPFKQYLKTLQNVLLCLPWLILIAPPKALANPLILECFTVHEALPRETFSVKMDEQTKSVTHAGMHDTFSVTGVFSPDQVTYQHLESEGFGLQTLQKYIVNRLTLKVTHFTISRGRNSSRSSTEISTGSCKSARVADDSKAGNE